MRGWFLLFVISIGTGGAFALMTAIARTPFVSDHIEPSLFYHWLIGHVDTALIIGLFSFLIFLWHKVFGREARGYELFLASAGFLMIAGSSAIGLGKPVHNNYLPTLLHPLFFIGVLLFLGGVLLTALRFIPVSIGALRDKEPVSFVLGVSVWLSLLLFISGLLSLPYSGNMEEVYLSLERTYWFPGHIHQFVNASLLMAVWFLLVRIADIELPMIFARLSLLFLSFPIVYILVQFLGWDPLDQRSVRLTTYGYALGIGIPTIIASIYIIFNGWAKRNSYSAVLVVSSLLYLVGAMIGYLIAGSDLRIPAHYHGVIASILTGVMGLTYYFLKELGFRRNVSSLVRWQPTLYGAGMILFVIALFWAGYFGAPRKTFGTAYIDSLKVYIFMGLMGVGSVVSVLSGAVFVLYSLISVVRRNGYDQGTREEEKEG